MKAQLPILEEMMSRDGAERELFPYVLLIVRHRLRRQRPNPLGSEEMRQVARRLTHVVCDKIRATGNGSGSRTNGDNRDS